MYRSLNIFKYLKQSFSTKPPSLTLESLKERILLKITGNEVTDYLQGLITNDMRHLNEGASCMYTMFLNTKGRVLYDAIIYKTLDDNTFLIECDINAAGSLQKHLKVYKLRKKIDIVKLDGEYSIYVMFNADNVKVQELDVFNKAVDDICINGDSIENSTKAIKKAKILNDIYIYKDPRMALLGSRIIAPKEKDIKKELADTVTFKNQHEHETYKWFRYSLGVGEGVNDLPPENCFPLEANCDYLHGVSFHKGCYLGQELTARTYHTGAVRKRLMPLVFSKLPSIAPENIINDKVNLGKLRGVEGNAGLALLRIDKCIHLENFTVSDGIATTHKPIWWPMEAPKEKISVAKNE